ncbi:hypothetical protein FHG87_024443 [Trinorchestia longiramus]|nr:hypothetical protein FHG87_024443 [Trinorchestia longiramus]
MLQAYTKALLSRFGMDKANSDATPVDINADLVKNSDEVEDCDKDLYQSAVGSLLILLSKDVVFNESQFISFEKEPSKEIECVPWSFHQEEKHEDSEGELELRRSTRNRADLDRFGGWV